MIAGTSCHLRIERQTIDRHRHAMLFVRVRWPEIDSHVEPCTLSVAVGDVNRVFLFTYTLARLMNLATVSNHVTRNPFAGQLELNILFDVTLAIDSAIKAKNPSKWKFIDHAECLLNAAGHAVTKAQLREINDQFEND
jgi:hypothetical protein